MSRQLINRSEDLQRLASEGFAIRIEAGHLLVEEIPFLDENGCIRHGVFACPLDATDEATLPPRDHVMSFSGGMPHDRHGKPLAALGLTSPRCSVIGSLVFQHGFSNKLRGPRGPRSYESFYEKVITYGDIIIGEVQAIDPSATARVGALPTSDTENDPFVYPDSASARAGTVELASKFKDEIVAFIGLGGTGGYILDHVAKTPVCETRLIDGDRLYPFNTFRAPGAPHKSELQPPPYKVDYYAHRYGLIKRNIIPHAVNLTPETFYLLDRTTFAFVSIDPCPEKAAIMAELERRALPFVDSGMGLHKGSNGIGGTLRAVLSTEANRDRVRPHIPVDPGGRDPIYENNIQISDLNSLNANMAVQLWKSFRGFYADFGEPVWLYQVETRQFIREAA
ncbi:ThiF family adenylyltransferase [Hoeflea poritis]|uniref:ThiF family adenylyltransferase n=1 Tax=Hoeflea poritis TaxID=2993659 RepID=A0ABT4VV97_9HYPH|nr:ThiF family adenylyltransferase [Hoeflea poritis]MDA4848621.1 ThiF family adenylyltransferase [Hoeflea poritis]